MRRDVKVMELYEIANLMMDVCPKPIFAKSVTQKYITGFVCKSMSDYVSHCSCKNKSAKMYVSKVLDIKTEFRTYVHWHSIYDCIRYKGEYFNSPDKDVLEQMLKDLKGSGMPCAYSIDVGILENGDSILIECNDCFALGNYGISSLKYAEMHRDRWYQLIEDLS